MSSQCRKRNPRPSGYPGHKHNLVDIADNASAEIEKDGNKIKYNTFLKLLSGETRSKCIGQGLEVVTDTGPMIFDRYFKFRRCR